MTGVQTCALPILIGRYGGLTGKTRVEGVGTKFMLVGNFWASKGRNFDNLDACMSVHSTNLFMFNKMLCKLLSKRAKLGLFLLCYLTKSSHLFVFYREFVHNFTINVF